MKKISFIILIILAVLILSGVCCDYNKCYNNEPIKQTDFEVEATPQPEVINEPKYTEYELDLLARVIWSEAGSDWLTDEHQRAVASVVINRVNDERFPNTINDVIYQKGQYGCVSNGMINRTPNQRAYDNAKYVLEYGITIPSNVVWQSQFKQGKGLYKYIQGHYFCY